MIERTDEVLAQRYRERGDREALTALIERNQGPIFAYLLRLLKNPHDAEEAAQEVFVRMLRGLPGYDPELPFRPWFYRIALNCARTAGQRRKMQSERERQSPGRAAGVTPVDAAVRSEVLKMVDDLPDSQREAVTLHYCQGLSHSEVASVLDVPAGTVATRIHTGLQSLRTRLAALGVAFAGLQLEQVLSPAEAAVAPGSILPSVLKTAAVQGGILVTKTKLSLVVAVGIACTVGGGVAGYAVRANRVERDPEMAAIPVRLKPVPVSPTRPPVPEPAKTAGSVPVPSPAPALPSSPAAVDPATKIRRLGKFVARMIKQMEDGAAGPIDEKESLEFLALMTDPEFLTKATEALAGGRTAEYNDEFTFALFEEFGVALNDAQKTRLSAILMSQAALEKNPDLESGTAVDRKIAELGAARASMDKILAILTPEQRPKIDALADFYSGLGQGMVLKAQTPDTAAAALLDAWSQRLTPLNDQERARAAQVAEVHARQVITLQEELRARYGEGFMNGMAGLLTHEEGNSAARKEVPDFRIKMEDAYTRLLEVERQTRQTLLSALPEKADVLRKAEPLVYFIRIQK